VGGVRDVAGGFSGAEGAVAAGTSLEDEDLRRGETAVSDYRANVEKGAAFLDERMPGWLDRVDVPNLDLGSCFRCVLGQLGGSYHDERLRLGLAYQESIELGFNVSALDNGITEAREYASLTEEWQAYIKEARDEVGS
jgi:hypothetical protein